MNDQDMEKVKHLVEALKDGLIIPGSEAPSSTYECPICKDTTYILDKDEEGRLVTKLCKCWERKNAEKLLKQSGLADSVEALTFDKFVCKTPNQIRMKETACKYLYDLLELRKEKKGVMIPWFYIGGNPGSGKTHICTAICGELLKKNIGVKYMQWVTESRRLKMSVNADDFDDLISEYTNARVLYIDDLLKQKYTPNPVFTEADIKVAFAILNARYIQNKPTIISSEWDLLRQLLMADEGVFSRVYERCKGYTVNIARKQENNFRLGGEAQ